MAHLFPVENMQCVVLPYNQFLQFQRLNFSLHMAYYHLNQANRETDLSV